MRFPAHDGDGTAGDDLARLQAAADAPFGTHANIDDESLDRFAARYRLDQVPNARVLIRERQFLRSKAVAELGLENPTPKLPSLPLSPIPGTVWKLLASETVTDRFDRCVRWAAAEIDRALSGEGTPAPKTASETGFYYDRRPGADADAIAAAADFRTRVGSPDRTAPRASEDEDDADRGGGRNAGYLASMLSEEDADALIARGEKSKLFPAIVLDWLVDYQWRGLSFGQIAKNYAPRPVIEGAASKWRYELNRELVPEKLDSLRHAITENVKRLAEHIGLPLRPKGKGGAPLKPKKPKPPTDD